MARYITTNTATALSQLETSGAIHVSFAMSGKDRQGAPMICLHFTGGKTHLKSESTPYTYRSGGPFGHLAIWTCKVHLTSCLDITSCLSFRFSARKTWGMHTIMVARDGYIWGAVKIYYNCLVCFWRVIVFWGGPYRFTGFCCFRHHPSRS